MEYIDKHILKRIWSIRKNTDLIVEIRALFKNTTEVSLKEVGEAFDLEDSQRTSYCLHKIKGGALNVGGHHFARLVEDQEKKISSNCEAYFYRKSDHYQSLQNIYEKTLKEVDDFIYALKSDSKSH